MFSQKSFSGNIILPPVAEMLERLRMTGDVSHQEWFELLEVQWKDYQDIKAGKIVPSEKTLERVAKHFKLDTLDLLQGQVDFQDLAVRVNQSLMPETYMKGAFGRRRTSITSVDFIEKTQGWRLRLDALRRLGVSESSLQDPFAPISIRFITDLCSYLSRRQFRSEDFYNMGAYTYIGNKNTLVGKMFSELGSAKEAYEMFFGDYLKFFEQNCTYMITKACDNEMTFEVLSNPHVAAENGVKHLGSVYVCSLKAGLIAHIPCYLGLPKSKIRETSCVHRGDSVCRFELDYTDANKSTRLSS